MDLLRKAHGVVQRLLDPGGERDRLALARGHIDAPDLPFAPDHDRLAVPRPRVLRVEAVNRPRFLQILVDVSEELAIAAALEIAEVQLARQTDAADDKRASFRPARSAALTDPPCTLTARRSRPVVEIAADDRVDGAVRILVVFERLPGVTSLL